MPLLLQYVVKPFFEGLGQGVGGSGVTDIAEPDDEHIAEQLRRVRRRVKTGHSTRVDLRDHMEEDSPAWDEYTKDHGVPGRKTRKRTVVKRLSQTIYRLSSS